MAAAEIDDDIIGRDPTAFRLKTNWQRSWERKQHFGTMGNLISMGQENFRWWHETGIGNLCSAALVCLHEKRAKLGTDTRMLKL
ncbi:hypothetical protein RchiOBHm_Chr3g0449771 [Rosa chinensis]|uniref:Uncharacterized protein n=1 Tax=Rosa chinensis TaxID=74649 RepID=A0A2P6R5L2_ROSCH|nr:hypothetical protein RchiOBHm_Chr3g0449771 [Rosa chinensis]